MSKKCRVELCGNEIPEWKEMCGSCWRSVPVLLRKRVFQKATIRSLCKGVPPPPDYYVAIDEAIRAVEPLRNGLFED